MASPKKLKGVEIEDLHLGDGPEAARGAFATVHYVGRLKRGDVFRNSYQEGAPIRFLIGRRSVMAGLEKGIVGMRVGGRRRLTVSPHLAFGERGVDGVVPPNAVLILEIELLDLTSKPGT